MTECWPVPRVSRADMTKSSLFPRTPGAEMTESSPIPSVSGAEMTGTEKTFGRLSPLLTVAMGFNSLG